MRQKIQTVASVLLVLFMPFMWYIELGDTKVNFSLADFLLPVIGILILLNIKELFLQKRWLVILYFAGLLFSLALSQFAGRFSPGFLHVPNSVMLMEMLKTAVVCVYFLSAFLLVNEKNFTISMVTVSLGSIPVMIVGFGAFIYHLQAKNFLIETYTLDRLRFRGTFEDPNLCALYFIVVFFVSLYCLKVIKSLFLRTVLVVVSCLSLGIIVLSQSRGGWLAFVVAIVVLTLMNIRYIKKKSILIILSVFILLLVAVNIDYVLQNGKITTDILNRMQVTASMETDEIDRVQLMKTAIQMGNDNFLLGVGKGSFPINSNIYLGDDSRMYKDQNIPHNTLLGFYSQQGIIGLFLFLLLPGFLFYHLLKTHKRQNVYFIALFFGLLLHSMTINIENVRFVWYALGLIYTVQLKNIEPELNQEASMKPLSFSIASAVMFCVSFILFACVATKMSVNIYIANGDIYEKRLSSLQPGDYMITFDIQTDDQAHTIEIYDGDYLIKNMVFKNANGVVHDVVSVKQGIRVLFKSSVEGWMRVKNALLIRGSENYPLYRFILLPEALQNLLNSKQALTYLKEPSFKNDIDSTGNEMDELHLINTRVVRYSNLTHVLEFEYTSKDAVDRNYQLDLLLEYPSISTLRPNENQINNKTHCFTLHPLTTSWEKGEFYSPKAYRLLISEDFNLLGRYYDYENNTFVQEAYFPIPYKKAFEKQEIVPLGEKRWINLLYGKDKENIIHMTYNGWVETERVSLETGNHTITFTAQGSYYDGYSQVRLRDSLLNEIAVITLDDIMKEYSVDYTVDEYQEGISFILELINYEIEKDTGKRQVKLKDILRVQ